MAGIYDNCNECGKSITHSKGRGKACKYCSDACSKLAAQKRKQARKLEGCCIDGCNELASRISSRMCERHYYQIRRTGKATADFLKGAYESCVYCGSRTNRNKYCSARCQARHIRKLPASIRCKNCQSEFTPINGKVCCSDRCALEHERRLARESYKIKMRCNPLYVAKVRSNEYKRKARKKNAFVEEVDRLVVMLRDKWICHLCGEKIPKDAKWPDRKFGTLDHVMPLNHGGLHSYANIKAAHLTCNCSKNDKIIGQLGLEFAA